MNKTTKLLAKFGSLVTHFVEYIVLTLLFWTVVPCLIIFLTPFYIFRLILLKIVTPLLHPDWSMMTLRDVFISEDMTKSKLTSITTFVFHLQSTSNLPEEPLELVREVQNLFENSILREKCYEKKLKFYIENWLGYPFWKKVENFCLANHIRLLQTQITNGNGDGLVGVVNAEIFMKILSPILTQPFKKGMSPWEILVVPNYGPSDQNSMEMTTTNGFHGNENKSVMLIFRFHHSLSDGFSFFNLICQHFGAHHDQHDKAAMMANIPQPPPPQKLTWLGHMGQFLWSGLTAGYIQSKYFVLNKEWPEWHPPARKLSGDTHAVFLTEAPIPFKELRDIGKKFQVSPTAVLFSAIAGGIQRYLKCVGGKQDNLLPSVMRGHFPWPQQNHPMTGLINHWTFVSMKFILKSANSLTRLRQMGDEFEGIKWSAMPRVAWSFMPLYTALPNPLLEIIGANRTSTLILSSFPGPKGPLNFLDRWHVNDMMFWLPRLRGNPSMQFGILSYNGNVRLTMAVDKAVFRQREDAKMLAQCIQQELVAIQLYHQDKLAVRLPEE